MKNGEKKSKQHAKKFSTPVIIYKTEHYNTQNNITTTCQNCKSYMDNDNDNIPTVEKVIKKSNLYHPYYKWHAHKNLNETNITISHYSSNVPLTPHTATANQSFVPSILFTDTWLHPFPHYLNFVGGVSNTITIIIIIIFTMLSTITVRKKS